MSIQRNAIKNMAHLDETPLVIRLLRSEIFPDPNQPRKKKRNPEKLHGLAQTMRVKQLQPILVTETTSGYQIIVGEGRWLAAGINEEELSEAQFLDCIVVDETNIGVIRTMQIVENMQREDMDQIDTAHAFQELIDLGICKNASEVAKHVGVSPATVSVYLAVLNKAPEDVQALVKSGAAKMDAAKDVVELAKVDPVRAKEIIETAKSTGKLERKVTREVLAEVRGKKPSAENDEANKGSIATPLEKSNVAPSDVVVTDAGESKKKLDQERVKTKPIPAKNVRILVEIKNASKDVWSFNAELNEHGAASLAQDMTHSTPGMLWVRFGDKSGNVGEFICADLVVTGVVAV